MSVLYCNGSLDTSAHSNFGPCQFRLINKSAYTISAHRYNKVFVYNWHNYVCLPLIIHKNRIINERMVRFN